MPHRASATTVLRHAMESHGAVKLATGRLLVAATTRGGARGRRSGLLGASVPGWEPELPLEDPTEALYLDLDFLSPRAQSPGAGWAEGRPSPEPRGYATLRPPPSPGPGPCLPQSGSSRAGATADTQLAYGSSSNSRAVHSSPYYAAAVYGHRGRGKRFGSNASSGSGHGAVGGSAVRHLRWAAQTHGSGPVAPPDAGERAGALQRAAGGHEPPRAGGQDTSAWGSCAEGAGAAGGAGAPAPSLTSAGGSGGGRATGGACHAQPRRPPATPIRGSGREHRALPPPPPAALALGRAGSLTVRQREAPPSPGSGGGGLAGTIRGCRTPSGGHATPRGEAERLGSRACSRRASATGDPWVGGAVALPPVCPGTPPASSAAPNGHRGDVSELSPLCSPSINPASDNGAGEALGPLPHPPCPHGAPGGPASPAGPPRRAATAAAPTSSFSRSEHLAAQLARLRTQWDGAAAEEEGGGAACRALSRTASRGRGQGGNRGSGHLNTTPSSPNAGRGGNATAAGVGYTLGSPAGHGSGRAGEGAGEGGGWTLLQQPSSPWRPATQEPLLPLPACPASPRSPARALQQGQLRLPGASAAADGGAASPAAQAAEPLTRAQTTRVDGEAEAWTQDAAEAAEAAAGQGGDRRGMLLLPAGGPGGGGRADRSWSRGSTVHSRGRNSSLRAPSRSVGSAAPAAAALAASSSAHPGPGPFTPSPSASSYDSRPITTNNSNTNNTNSIINTGGARSSAVRLSVALQSNVLHVMNWSPSIRPDERHAGMGSRSLGGCIVAESRVRSRSHAHAQGQGLEGEYGDPQYRGSVPSSGQGGGKAGRGGGDAMRRERMRQAEVGGMAAGGPFGTWGGGGGGGAAARRQLKVSELDDRRLQGFSLSRAGLKWRPATPPSD